MILNLVVIQTLILVCFRLDIISAKRDDGSEHYNNRIIIKHYKINKINGVAEFNSGTKIDGPLYNEASEFKNISLNTEQDNTINNVNPHPSINSNLFLNSMNSRKINSTMYIYNTQGQEMVDKYHINVSQINQSKKEIQLVRNIYNDSYRTEKSMQGNSEKEVTLNIDCITICNNISPNIKFTVNPKMSHFLSGSAFILLCEIPVSKRYVSQVFFHFKGIKFVGPICTAGRLSNTEGCVKFPSVEWSVIDNKIKSIYSEEITFLNIEESQSGYYTCVVELKCCGISGIHMTNITKELTLPISISSFVQFRTEIIVIVLCIILLFIFSISILCNNIILNCSNAHISKDQLIKNRAINEFSLASDMPEDESNRFI